MTSPYGTSVPGTSPHGSSPHGMSAYGDARERDTSRPCARRTFLARIGVLGAAAGMSALLPGAAAARPAGLSGRTSPANPLGDGVELLRPVLAELARDTMNGLAVFACPGPDEYSAAQGTPRAEPGAMEAGTADFLIEALDNFVPFPDELARPVAASLATGLTDSGIELPGMDTLPNEIGTLDAALGALLENDAALPLSLPIASLLNLVATAVNPAAVNGAFGSPFARLTYAEKASVFEIIETPAPELVSTLDVQLPQPLTESVSGLLKFVGGALIEFASFGSYTEYAVFDPETKQLTGRPVGWRLTGYQQAGPVEGWDEFIGYYQGRTEVHD